MIPNIPRLARIEARHWIASATLPWGRYVIRGRKNEVAVTLKPQYAFADTLQQVAVFQTIEDAVKGTARNRVVILAVAVAAARYKDGYLQISRADVTGPGGPWENYVLCASKAIACKIASEKLRLEIAA